MRTWLSDVFRKPELTEESLGYLLGRGVREQTIHRLGITLWETPSSAPPDKDFAKRYRDGKYLDGRLTCPAFSPRGELIGFEARTWLPEDGKKITDFRLPEAAWNPFFLGLTPDKMTQIWDGADIWIFEGLFDLAPMERIMPASDVGLATVRAKVSESHVQFVRRHLRRGHRVLMVYDNDTTGRKQTVGWTDPNTGQRRWGALEVFERVGVPAEQVLYTGGKDPGEIWDRGGEAALRAAFSHML